MMHQFKLTVLLKPIAQGLFAMILLLAFASAGRTQTKARIAFMSTRAGGGDIYVMNADGSRQVRLTNNKSEESSPSWSPDGTRIAFASDRDNTNWEIYVMSADGSNQINLTQNAAWDSGPAWAPAPLAVSPKGKLSTQWATIKRMR